MAGAQPGFSFPNVGFDLRQVVTKQREDNAGAQRSDAFRFAILGSIEIQSINHPFQRRWQDLLVRVKREKDNYAGCDAHYADCPDQVRRWRDLLKASKHKPIDIQLALLKKSVNRMAKYEKDVAILGQSDHWATPMEFLNGRADCEDYAVVKFLSLLELGFSNDQQRLSVVRDQRRRILHAVVTVDLGDRTVVLDSLFDHPVEQQYVFKYAPVFSAHLEKRWAHVVTKKMRVAYLDQLERRKKGLVLKANARPAYDRRLAQPAARVTRRQEAATTAVIE
jgi:predicted transglutaminase-like cysteine proteinase